MSLLTLESYCIDSWSVSGKRTRRVCLSLSLSSDIAQRCSPLSGAAYPVSSPVSEGTCSWPRGSAPSPVCSPSCVESLRFSEKVSFGKTANLVGMQGTPREPDTPPATHLSSKNCGKKIVANRKVAKAQELFEEGTRHGGEARDPAEPGAEDNQGPAETVDRTRTGTGPTPTLTARRGTQAQQNASRIP